MPNKNYLKGIALEREIVNLFKDVGCHAARTAGSHGKYDLYAVGTIDQMSLAVDRLQIAGFRPTKDRYERTARRYCDQLFFHEVVADKDAAIFIQCKRKEK